MERELLCLQSPLPLRGYYTTSSRIRYVAAAAFALWLWPPSLCGCGCLCCVAVAAFTLWLPSLCGCLRSVAVLACSGYRVRVRLVWVQQGDCDTGSRLCLPGWRVWLADRVGCTASLPVFWV